MREEKYRDLILNDYDIALSLKVTKSAQSYIKVLKNSIYGTLPSINDIRSEKIEKILKEKKIIKTDK